MARHGWLVDKAPGQNTQKSEYRSNKKLWALNPQTTWFDPGEEGEELQGMVIKFCQ